MKTIRNEKTKLAVCSALVLFVLAPSVFAQADDANAAILYMRAFLLYEEPGEDLSNMLDDLRTGDIKPNDQIRGYLQKNKPLIELITTASQISNCDWEWDLSNIEIVMPELSYGRKMAFLLVYDSKVLLDDGDYKGSLERCLTMYRMAGHFSNDLIISNLVSIAMSALASGNIRSTLSQMPADVEILQWLKSQMQDIPATSSIVSAITNEIKVNTEYMSGIEGIFPEENVQHLQELIAETHAAIVLPYEDAYGELEKLNDKIAQEDDTNLSVVLNEIVTPITRLLTNETRKDTEFNATNAAIEIYLIKAENGQLPDELPDGLPKDLFSGEDFIYEKSDDGFILRCRGKDLSNDENYEYEFKLNQ